MSRDKKRKDVMMFGQRQHTSSTDQRQTSTASIAPKPCTSVIDRPLSPSPYRHNHADAHLSLLVTTHHILPQPLAINVSSQLGAHKERSTEFPI